jgi:hypothetical protein
MSREDILFLTGLVAIPIWTFVALPLSYGDAATVTVIQIFVKILSTLSALCGGVGTYLMFKYSVSLIQLTPNLNPKLIQQVNAENAKRERGQKIGLGFLIGGVILGVISTWLS